MNGRAVATDAENNESSANDLHQSSLLVRSPLIKSPNHSEGGEGDQLFGNHTDGVNDDQTGAPPSHLPPRNIIEKVSRSQLDFLFNMNGMDVAIFLNHPEIMQWNIYKLYFKIYR